MTQQNFEPLHNLLLETLSIPSPTFREQEMKDFLTTWLNREVPGLRFLESGNSFICSLDEDKNRKAGKPHICLVGHTDTVPEYFKPYIENGRAHGSGASDMKGALPAFLLLLAEYAAAPEKCPYTLSFIAYAAEEGTSLPDNGISHLRNDHPDFFRSVDLAIIGEPTDRTIQIGCVGSIHVRVTICGEEAHSARPWTGKNALYEALPFIEYFKQLERVPFDIAGVRFYDVISITQSEGVTPGRTTIPGTWWCNVNYRFSPDKELKDAETILFRHIEAAGAKRENCEILDAVYAGKVKDSALFDEVLSQLGLPRAAKQAWTDVAQFGEEGISAMNYGPGLTSQAHKQDEFLELDDLNDYYIRLRKLLVKE